MSDEAAEGALLQALWPTPFGRFRFGEATVLNPLLSRMFGVMRALVAGGTAGADGGPSSFYASSDDLLSRINLSEWQHFLEFVAHCIQRTAGFANRQAWGEGRRSLQLDIAGMWFQISNRGAGHDVHTHGNCSWSGIYYVQVDPAEQRGRHADLGTQNGVTRFYGDYFNKLGGACADIGNAYLQQCHLDVEPEEGLLLIFPSWLPHRALPYSGTRDRIIISFNARVNSADGDNRMFDYAAA